MSTLLDSTCLRGSACETLNTACGNLNAKCKEFYREGKTQVAALAVKHFPRDSAKTARAGEIQRVFEKLGNAVTRAALRESVLLALESVFEDELSPAKKRILDRLLNLVNSSIPENLVRDVFRVQTGLLAEPIAAAATDAETSLVSGIVYDKALPAIGSGALMLGSYLVGADTEGYFTSVVNAVKTTAAAAGVVTFGYTAWNTYQALSSANKAGNNIRKRVSKTLKLIQEHYKSRMPAHIQKAVSKCLSLCESTTAQQAEITRSFAEVISSYFSQKAFPVMQRYAHAVGNAARGVAEDECARLEEAVSSRIGSQAAAAASSIARQAVGGAQEGLKLVAPVAGAGAEWAGTEVTKFAKSRLPSVTELLANVLVGKAFEQALSLIGTTHPHVDEVFDVFDALLSDTDALNAVLERAKGIANKSLVGSEIFQQLRDKVDDIKKRLKGSGFAEICQLVSRASGEEVRTGEKLHARLSELQKIMDEFQDMPAPELLKRLETFARQCERDTKEAARTPGRLLRAYDEFASGQRETTFSKAVTRLIGRGTDPDDDWDPRYTRHEWARFATNRKLGFDMGFLFRKDVYKKLNKIAACKAENSAAAGGAATQTKPWDDPEQCGRVIDASLASLGSRVSALCDAMDSYNKETVSTIERHPDDSSASMRDECRMLEQEMKKFASEGMEIIRYLNAVESLAGFENEEIFDDTELTDDELYSRAQDHSLLPVATVKSINRAVGRQIEDASEPLRERINRLKMQIAQKEARENFPKLFSQLRDELPVYVERLENNPIADGIAAIRTAMESGQPVSLESVETLKQPISWPSYILELREMSRLLPEESEESQTFRKTTSDEDSTYSKACELRRELMRQLDDLKEEINNYNGFLSSTWRAVSWPSYSGSTDQVTSDEETAAGRLECASVLAAPALDGSNSPSPKTEDHMACTLATQPLPQQAATTEASSRSTWFGPLWGASRAPTESQETTVEVVQHSSSPTEAASTGSNSPSPKTEDRMACALATQPLPQQAAAATALEEFYSLFTQLAKKKKGAAFGAGSDHSPKKKKVSRPTKAGDDPLISVLRRIYDKRHTLASAIEDDAPVETGLYCVRAGGIMKEAPSGKGKLHRQFMMSIESFVDVELILPNDPRLKYLLGVTKKLVERHKDT